MKVWDRYEGVEVELPDKVEPGRYQVRTRCTLNGHADLHPGDILWSDGNNKCLFAGDRVTRTFRAVADGRAGRSQDPTIDDAVEAVVAQAASPTATQSLPSPIMPAQLEDHVALLDVERLVDGAMDAGHLQDISRSPRMDMRYDVELQSVSRAKRLAPDALTTLASRSQDWSRRSLTGIVPKRVKSLVSEDELAIYENIVYARLIDRVLAILNGRVASLGGLLARCNDAQLLSQAQQLDHRLRDDICELWGRSFADNPDAAARVRGTLDQLIRLREGVRVLQHAGLYTRVPQHLGVPSSLKSTNILQHDARYRHLAPIWIAAHANINATARTPSQAFETAKALGERYASYVALLARHALSASKMFVRANAQTAAGFGPWTVHLSSEIGGCRVELREQGQVKDGLRLVAAWHGHRTWASQRDDHQVFFCHGSSTEGDPDGEVNVLNPLQFYVVERVRLVIERWILKRVLSAFPFRVAPVPAQLQGAICATAGDGVAAHGHGIEFFKPLELGVQREMEAVIDRATANEETKTKLRQSLRLVCELGTCRVCGHANRATNFRGSAQGFAALCAACGARSTLKRSNNQPVHAEFLTQEGPRPFEEVGCRQITIDW